MNHQSLKRNKLMDVSHKKKIVHVRNSDLTAKPRTTVMLAACQKKKKNFLDATDKDNFHFYNS